MTYSIIQKSQLEGAKRLDAEYYQPEYLVLTDRLNRLKSQPLSSLVDKLDVGFVSSMKDQFQYSGVPLLRTQNVKEFFVDLESDVVYVDEDFHSRSKKTQIYPGYVLLARSGSIGAACVVPKNFGLANSADIILINPSENFDPYFLAAFLNSKYGRFQIERGISGGIQGHINLYTLEQLQIPSLAPHTQGTIRSVIEAGLEQLGQSKLFYSQAERMLLEELGLAEESFADELCYVVDYSKMTEAERIDADYFQPKYKKLLSKLKEQNAKPLGELVLMRKGIEVGGEAYQDEGFSFIRVSNVSKEGLDLAGSKFIGEDAYRKLQNNFEPQVGEILLTKDATPGIAYTVKESVQGIAAGGILQLKLKGEIDAEYLALCVNSTVGQLQAERDAGGSVIAHWKPKQIKNLLIPILPKTTQQKIADLVKKSYQARKKSKELLEEAKRKVEEMVEKER